DKTSTRNAAKNTENFIVSPNIYFLNKKFKTILFIINISFKVYKKTASFEVYNETNQTYKNEDNSVQTNRFPAFQRYFYAPFNNFIYGLIL
ncbi:MAG: hypothetical protein KF888_12595, partial [Nitrosomonas sp.]|nr:hypothetical protein [Nitrosomonas sp.]